MKKLFIITILGGLLFSSGFVLAGNVGTANSVRGNAIFIDSLNQFLNVSINAQQKKDGRPTRGKFVVKSEDRTLEFDVKNIIVAGSRARIALVCIKDSDINSREGEWIRLFINDLGDRQATLDEIAWEWVSASEAIDYVYADTEFSFESPVQIKGNLKVTSF
ncbi:hypothetical protein C0583_00725 [Candidatus Parcubacteria bacterium]|nr:MAG: hypothetical protein C0583_00725 [Candidatus Parcubacteria bacterium]